MIYKTILSAIALIGMTIASYGANQVKVNEIHTLKNDEAPLKTCIYTIRKNGKVVKTVHVTDVPEGENCSDYSNAVLKMYLDGKI